MMNMLVLGVVDSIAVGERDGTTISCHHTNIDNNQCSLSSKYNDVKGRRANALHSTLSDRLRKPRNSSWVPHF